MTPTYLGNTDLLKQPMVAYFCSKEYTAQSVLLSYDWATDQKQAGKVVISTFRSPIEQDVLHFLLKNHQSVIVVLNKRMYKRIPEQFKEAYEAGQVLFISLCPETAIRSGQGQANQANRYALSLVSEVVFGCVTPGSNTEKLYHYAEKMKNVTIKTIL